MTPYYERDGITLYVGDNREVLPALDVTVSAVVTDPPYGLSFMGKDWDHEVPGVAFWEAMREAMLPGAHLLSFGGSRTFHRIAVAIEDAGFELRDTLMWLYGSGFPKSHDVSKAIDKRGGYPHLAAEIGKALKEARESRGMSASECDRIFCDGTTNWSWFEGRPKGQRAPTPETFARIVEQWPELAPYAEMVAEAEREVIGQKKAGIATPGDVDRHTVGGSRAVDVDITAPATPEAAQWAGWGTALKPAHEPVILARKPLCGTVAANVLAHGTGALNIDASRIGTEPAFVNRLGHKSSGGIMNVTAETRVTGGGAGRWPANVVLDEAAAAALDAQSGERKSGALRPYRERHVNASSFRMERDKTYTKEADTGGASRFFYCAKASRAERRRGLPDDMDANHPTVKPLALMRYLVTLITPPGGIVLDPFAGSGSTLVACAELGVPAIGIELSPEYCEIIARRVDHALNERAACVVQPSLLEGVAD